MSEPEETETESVETEQFDPPYDWMLDSMVGAVAGEDERSELGFSVTLIVQGAMVGGTLCSAGEWLKAMTEQETGHPQGAEFLRGVGRSLDEGIDKVANARDDRRRREFVHLKEAVIHHGTTSFNVVAWRGRLSQVAGWSLGAPNA